MVTMDSDGQQSQDGMELFELSQLASEVENSLEPKLTFEDKVDALMQMGKSREVAESTIELYDKRKLAQFIEDQNVSTAIGYHKQKGKLEEELAKVQKLRYNSKLGKAIGGVAGVGGGIGTIDILVDALTNLDIAQGLLAAGVAALSTGAVIGGRKLGNHLVKKRVKDEVEKREFEAQKAEKIQKLQKDLGDVVGKLSRYDREALHGDYVVVADDSVGYAMAHVHTIKSDGLVIMRAYPEKIGKSEDDIFRLKEIGYDKILCGLTQPTNTPVDGLTQEEIKKCELGTPLLCTNGAVRGFGFLSKKSLDGFTLSADSEYKHGEIFFGYIETTRPNTSKVFPLSAKMLIQPDSLFY